MAKNELFSINLLIDTPDQYKVSVTGQSGERTEIGACSEISITAKNRNHIKALQQSLEQTLKQLGDFFDHCDKF